jgi:hypothetical protein
MGHCGPRLHLSHPFCFPYPDPSPTRTCPCRAARPLLGSAATAGPHLLRAPRQRPALVLPIATWRPHPRLPPPLLASHPPFASHPGRWLECCRLPLDCRRRHRLPPLPVSATPEALPVKCPCPSPSSLIPHAPGPQRCRLRPPECLTAVEPLPRRPHFHPPHRRPSPVSFRHPHLSWRHPIAALVATMKNVFGSGHRRALGECTTARPARVRRVVTVSTPRSRHGPIDRLFPVGPRPWAKLPAHYCSLFFNFWIPFSSINSRAFVWISKIHRKYYITQKNTK